MNTDHCPGKRRMKCPEVQEAAGQIVSLIQLPDTDQVTSGCVFSKGSFIPEVVNHRIQKTLIFSTPIVIAA